MYLPKIPFAQVQPNSIPEPVMLRILRAEDERRWDADLASLLTNNSARVRHRAALAAGRIGNERAVGSLTALLRGDVNIYVKQMAAFALGEIEAAGAADALTEALRTSLDARVRANAIEALGKIAAALPKTEEARTRLLGETILDALANESKRTPQPDRNVLLKGLTAALRAHPANAGARLAAFLSNPDARVRADAANTLARLRAKEANYQLRMLLQQDADAIVRANAARALGAAEDKAAFEGLARSINDNDERVRVSAVRALGALKDSRAVSVLLPRAQTLFALYRSGRVRGAAHSYVINELLEIATTLGRVPVKGDDERVVTLLRAMREAENFQAPEIEIALARIRPASYMREQFFNELADKNARAKFLKDWRVVSSISQGLGEYAKLTSADAGNGAVGLQVEAQTILRSWTDDADTSAIGLPDVLRALASFKPADLGEVLRRHLSDKDVIVRATVAELLGEITAPNEMNARSLAAALPLAMHDEMNDAALAILDALAKQKTSFANEAIEGALASADHLLRRRAVALLKTNDAGDYSARIGIVTTRNTNADYARALARSGKLVRAIVATDKGTFTIELLPADAPLTVDNFVQLARRGFFNNVSFHRVVPNFVIQGGDPRGDGSGGPNYQIRCEINEVEYDRGAVGMALSGKDTGGSQWFVTHSPQPHLNGGYTVFGRVIEGLNVVDQIARGDVIRSVIIRENDARRAAQRRR